MLAQVLESFLNVGVTHFGSVLLIKFLFPPHHFLFFFFFFTLQVSADCLSNEQYQMSNFELVADSSLLGCHGGKLRSLLLH